MYAPTPVPESAAELPGYLSRELQALAQSLAGTQDFLILQTLHVEPAKPREGMVVKADGTDWDPGAGAGFYGYDTGAWVQLG
jgi:hypothetical protein